MPRKAVVLGAVGGAAALGMYLYGSSQNTSSHPSTANQSRAATDKATDGKHDLSVKGVERSGGGV
ncbi:hypothetical protein PYCC9005_005550 [Savitreella phatthalungensis]